MKTLRILFLVILSIIASLVTFTMGFMPIQMLKDMVSNNLTLARIEGEFEEISHPPNTRLVSQRSAVGLLAGNSNHCDYFVGQLRTYSGNRDILHEYYEKQKSIDPYGPVELLFIDDEPLYSFSENPLDHLSYEFSDPAAWSDADITADEHYFVYVFLIGFAPGRDPRCH
jgi:hypothetical protein